jgi:flagellar operon protein
MSAVNSTVNPPFVPIGGFDKVNQKPKVGNISSRPFDKILQDHLKPDELTFSTHAKKRLFSRNIELTQEEISNLNDAVRKAESKGAKESLILMGDNGFIVSVTNKKVITAVNQNELKENVFTNIDSAVIV